jgi:6-pyruvoyltetrahydropterin/6-carboxytetrahydropterin synthase
MPYEISTEVGFSAAHFIEGYQGDCARLHGHNWKVRVAIKVAERKSTGLTYDFRKLKTLSADVVSPLDHSVLNDLSCLEGRNATAETIAEWIFREISRRIDDPSVTVSRIEVWESPLNCAAYFEE